MSTFERDEIKNGMSVVVPYLNESEGIVAFCNCLDAYAASIPFDLEMIFVDDGSTDDTSSKVVGYNFNNIKKVKLLTLSKNFGSHAAIRAGVLHSSYDICTWMGSDLQEPVQFLDMSFQKIMEGYDAVYIEKKSIKIAKVNRGFSRIYSCLMRKYAVSNYSSMGISNIVFDKKIKEMLNKNIESNSSIMLQIMDAGYKSTTFSLNYNERHAGMSKWTFSKKIKLFVDSFVSFSFAPIRLVSMIGLFMFLLGFCIGAITFVNKLVNPVVPVGYSTLVSVLSLGFGITNISLGIIAEYLWRAYDAARKRPVFIISDEKEII